MRRVHLFLAAWIVAVIAFASAALPTLCLAQADGGAHHHHKAASSPSPAADGSPPPASSNGSATPAPGASPTPVPTGPANSPAPQAVNKNPVGAPAAVSSIDAGDIEGFDALPEPIRRLLSAALDLTRRNLTYTYGSSDPANGGMDCSGTVAYLLKSQGLTDVPRDASEQYTWVRHARFYAVLSRKQDNFELNELRPGDLMFWTGTYNIDRDPPVTHTMIYLGKRKKDGHRLMVGASDGRPYDGQKRNGVSVFDFRMPAAREGDAADASTAAAPDHAPVFAGYGPVPGMADLNDAAARQTAAAHGSTQGSDDADKGDRAARTGHSRATGASPQGNEDAPKTSSKASPSPTPRHSHRSSSSTHNPPRT